MGGPLHREPAVRRAPAALLLPLILLVAGGSVLVWQKGWLKPASRQAALERAQPRKIPAAPETVAALGRLEPAGDIRVLAAPIGSMGVTPRLSALLVSEGQSVVRGQLLARFDTAPTQRAQQQLLRTRIDNLNLRLRVENRELERYRQLTRQGAVAADELDRRQQDHLLLQGQLLEARSELEKVEVDLDNTELRAPIDGTVLRVNSRVGERPGEKGILEIGSTDSMEAVVEVYESDIARVRPGMAVKLTSENGGFQGTLTGRVQRISPQVRQRQVLSTDPTGDADARIVEVRVALDRRDAQRVSRLTGLKVIARLQP